MAQVVKKIESTGNTKILLTERGTSFGYNTLVADMRSRLLYVNWVIPLFSMQPIPSNHPVDKVIHLVAMADLPHISQKQQLLLVLMDSLLKHTLIPTKHFRMDLT